MNAGQGSLAPLSKPPQSTGPDFVGAENGVSLAGGNSGPVVLGNDVDSVDQFAQLLSDRDIPMKDLFIRLFQEGAINMKSLIIGTSNMNPAAVLTAAAIEGALTTRIFVFQTDADQVLTGITDNFHHFIGNSGIE